MNRPTGVTLIAILCFIGAAFLVGLGGILIIAGGGVPRYHDESARRRKRSAGDHGGWVRLLESSFRFCRD